MADPTPAASKAVKSITLSIGNTTYRVVSSPFGKPESVESVDVSTLSDRVKRKLPVPQKESGDINVTVADDGNAPTVGDIETCTFTVATTTGSGSDGTSTVSVNCFVASVTPATIDTGTNRFATLEIVLTPTGAA